MSSYIDEDVKNYIEKKSNFQNKILEFIDENGEDESKIDIYKYFDELKSQNYAFDVKKILILLKTIIDYHHRGNNFYAQMEKIFIYFKEDIKQAFNNTELFDLFSESKLALLILLENEMIQIDESIAKTLTKSEQDRDYFLYQLLQFYSNRPLTTINPEHVEKTKLGVNMDYLPTLIRTDLVDDFITHVNGKNISLNSYISISIYETNRLLINEYVQPTLIEYATFYGSIKIFQYLKTNNVKLTPSLWIYAIHSNNAELIHILEENNIEPEDKTYETCFVEAVKCHHNDIVNYFLNTKKFKHFYLGTYWENENYDLIPIDQDSYTQWIFSLGGLYYSIQENPELYDLLFKASYIDVNRINNNETLLSIAMTNNNKKVIKLLASNPKCDTNIKFKMNGKEYTALIYAVENNQIDVVQLLFENQNIDPNTKLEISYGNEKTALSTAIQNNQIKIIELLVSNPKCDTNIKFKMNGIEYTALTYAVENNQIDVVQILLVNQNTDPNIVFKKDGKDYTLLSMAIEINKIDLIQSILSNENTDPNFILEVDGKSFTALSLTIEKDNFELFKTLVSHPKTDPNIILKTGYYTENTAAKMIIEKNNKEMIELLLSNQNFNPNTKFNAGDYIKCEKTVLSMVFEANNSELMEQLFTRIDLDPNVKFVEDKMNKTFSFESEEKTILSMAIENDNIEIVRQILSLPNIDINLKLSRKNKDTQTTIKENTVLQLALTKGNREIINLLLNNEKINLKII